MMRTLLYVAGAIVISAVCAGAAAQTSRAAVTLQAAVAKETIEGDIQAALALYAQAAAEAGGDRTLTARALIGLAQAQEKAGQRDARATFERIVRDYADSGEPYTIARARLAATPNGADAGVGRAPFARIDTDFIAEPGGSVKVSPDGAFAASRNGTALEIRKLPAGPTSVIGDIDGSSSAFAWSPDSRSMAVLKQNRRARTVELRVTAIGGASKVLASWPGGLTFDGFWWSPNGRWIAFTQSHLTDAVNGCELNVRVDSAPPPPCVWDLRLIPSSGGQARVIADRLSTLRSSAVMWSPDSGQIAFLTTPAQPEGPTLHVADVSTAAAAAFSIPPAASIGSLVSWTRGGEIVFQQGDDIVFATASSGAMRRSAMGRGDTLVGAARGGSAYVVLKAASRRYALKTEPDGREQPITVGAGQESRASISPDGRVMLFASDREGKWALYAAALDRIPEPNPIRLLAVPAPPVPGASATPASWSDGGVVFMPITSIAGTLYRAPVDAATGTSTGPLQRLTSKFPMSELAAVSPDSQRLAFFAGGSDAAIALVEGDGTHERALVDGTETKLRWRTPEAILTSAGADMGSFRPSFVTVDAQTGIQSPAATMALAPGETIQDWAYRPGADEILYTTTPAPRPATGPTAFKLHPLAGGTDRLLTTRERVDGFTKSLAVSPDGAWAAYTAAGVIKLIALAHPEEDRALAPNAIRPRTSLAWSPSGTRLIACTAMGTCDVIRVDTGETTPFTASGAEPGVRWLAADWSPDGRFIVLSGNHARSDWYAFNGVTQAAVDKLLGRVKANSGGSR